MLPEISQKFTRLEQIWQNYFQIIDGASEEQRHFKPAPDKWCMLEVAQHIIGSENGTLRFFSKYQPKQVKMTDKVSGVVRSLVLTLALKSPFKFKVPNVPGLNPKNIHSWEQIIAEWRDIQNGLRQYFQDFPSEHLNHIVFKHPVAGKFNVFQTLDFLNEHATHHLFQLERIKNTPGFPSS